MVADRAPLVRHCSACSSFCWSVTAVTDLSARAMVTDPSVVCRSFAPRPSDRPSLLCLFVRRLSGTSPSLVRVVDPSLVFLLESSLSYRCLVARPLGSTRLHSAPLGTVFASFRLFGSTLREARLFGSTLREALFHSTRPARIPILSVGCVWPPRCSHTLCPTRGVPSLCYHSLVVPQL